MTGFDKVLDYIQSAAYKPELVFIDYDERLSDEYIQAYVDNDWEALYDIMEIYLEGQHYGFEYEIKEGFHHVCPEFDYTKLTDHQQGLIMDAIFDADTSDPIADLARNTPPALFQVDLQSCVDRLEDEEPSTAFERAIEPIGVEPTKHLVDQLESIWVEQDPYGCEMNLIAYMDIDEAARLNKHGGHIEGAQLVLLDSINGACYFGDFDARVKVDPGMVYLDSLLGYGSVDEICGVVHHAFEADMEVIE